jgi:hypothetical protein
MLSTILNFDFVSPLEINHLADICLEWTMDKGPALKGLSE